MGSQMGEVGLNSAIAQRRVFAPSSRLKIGEDFKCFSVFRTVLHFDLTINNYFCHLRMTKLGVVIFRLC